MSPPQAASSADTEYGSCTNATREWTRHSAGGEYTPHVVLGPAPWRLCRSVHTTEEVNSHSACSHTASVMPANIHHTHVSSSSRSWAGRGRSSVLSSTHTNTHLLHHCSSCCCVAATHETSPRQPGRYSVIVWSWHDVTTRAKQLCANSARYCTCTPDADP